jgi:deoxyribose-phosphate aldolase
MCADIAQYIDHTLLRPDATRKEIEALCKEASTFGFATVCVNPSYVSLCKDLLSGSNVKVCTVVGFPLGSSRSDVKAFEARAAIDDGAVEIDMVMNVGALKSKDYSLVERDIRSVVEACKGSAKTKVIIEAALLTTDEKIQACALAKAAGADFVKTSTGFGPGGATLEDVELMRKVVGTDMGVKAAGGIKDCETARGMIQAGATRIGASASIKIIEKS